MEWICASLAGVVGVLVGVVGIVVFVGLLLVVIFWLVSRATKRMAEDVAKEGPELRSGMHKIKTSLKRYKSARAYYGHKISLNYGEVLLVPSALVVVAGIRMLRFANEDLSHAEMSIDGPKLRFKTSKPTGATGEVEVVFQPHDPSAWLRALESRGVRAR